MSALGETLRGEIHSEDYESLKSYISENKVNFGTCPGSEEYPFLFIAFDTCNFDIINLLLENGADINIQNNIGLSVVDVAVNIDCHVDCYEKYVKGEVKLLFTCNFEMTKFAISKKADINLICEFNGQRSTPLDSAINHHYYDLANFLRNNGGHSISELPLL